MGCLHLGGSGPAPHRLWRGAATADPKIAGFLRQLGERGFQDTRSVADALARLGALRSGMTIQEATDILWALASADLFRLLVRERGWPPDRYKAWVASTCPASVLAGPPAWKED